MSIFLGLAWSRVALTVERPGEKWLPAGTEVGTLRIQAALWDSGSRGRGVALLEAERWEPMGVAEPGWRGPRQDT